MSQITIYTDGGCSGNPGPGGWAYIICRGEAREEANGFDASTTNNKMELTAVIMAIEKILSNPEDINMSVEINTDSQYVKNGITSWIHSWMRNGWKTAAKKPVKNKELWIRLKAGADKLKITWKWVEGHAGIPLNEAVDGLVQEAIAAGQ